MNYRSIIAALALLCAPVIALAQPAELPSPFTSAPDTTPPSSLPLPAGASTEAYQAATISALGTLLTNTQLRAAAVPISLPALPALAAGSATIGAVNQAGTWTVGISGSVAVTGTFWQATQPVSISGTVPVSGPLTDAQLRATAVPVSAASLPLPAGAATAANQTTANSSLTSIDGKLPALGQAAMAASVPVVIASNQSAVPVLGTFWQATQPISGSVGVIGSAAVTGTFWQATQPVSAVSIPLPAGAATEATLSAQSAKLPATPALGTAGTPSADVITVQGATGGTPQQVNPSFRATYSAYYLGIAVTASASFLQIQGSATKTIRITRIAVSGTLTTAAVGDVVVVKTSTGASGGAPVVGSTGGGGIAKHDSLDGSVTATLTVWSTPPSSPGTLAGGVRARKMLASSTTTAPTPVVLDFGEASGRALYLRGTSEYAQVYLIFSSFTGASFNADLEWTEE